MLTEQQERPAGRYITDLEVEYAGSILLRADWGQGISRNPFLMFRFSPERFEGELHIRWIDNRGDRDELVVPI
jgi:sulfur-oxidizing protein SoxZ